MGLCRNNTTVYMGLGVTMNDEQSLLDAIAEHPADTTLKLAHADLVAESDPVRAALLRVYAEPDNDDWRLQWASVCGDESRAKLVQFQCKLARMVPESEWSQYGRNNLREFGDVLIKGSGDRWRKGPACDNAKCMAGRPFTSCMKCHGTNDMGGLMQRDSKPPFDGTEWQYEVTYHRGMKRVYCNMADVCALTGCHNCANGSMDSGGTTPWGDPIEVKCETCDGDGAWWEPTGWIRRVCKHHPDVTEVWLEDKRPVETVGGQLWCPNDTTESWILPPRVFHLLSNWDDERPETRVSFAGRYYRTVENARVFLSRAVANWVRTFPCPS